MNEGGPTSSHEQTPRSLRADNSGHKSSAPLLRQALDKKWSGMMIKDESVNRLNRDVQILVANLDGWLRGLAEINGLSFQYRGGAYTVKLDNKYEPEHSFRIYFKETTEYNREHFKEVDWPTYTFENWQEFSPWVGPLEEALKDYLLPNPFNQVDLLDENNLETIKCRVAWHVMELIMLITDSFSNESIYKVNYEREKFSEGIFYVIPIETEFLVLDFGSLLPEVLAEVNS